MLRFLETDERNTLEDLAFLLFWAVCFCVLGIGRGSLASWDEAYYAIVSKGIVATGDWVNLKYFGVPFYDKPPLYLWETAFFYKLWGVSEFTTRLGSALAGVGVVFLTYFIGKRLFGRLAGLASAGVVLSSTDFLHYTRWGTLDITLVFFFALAIYAYMMSEEGPSGWWLLFWGAAAGAVMTKGLVIVLVWIFVGLQAFFTRDFSFLKRKSFWAGFALFLALILPWHVAAYFGDPQAFMSAAFKHYVSRASTVVEGHAGNWYFYIRTLINKYHPWILLALLSLPWTVWNAFRSEKRPENRFVLTWIAVVFLFFTFLIRTKLQWYILPLHPALSITVGALLAQWFKKRELWLKGLIALVLLLHLPFSSVVTQDYSAGIKALAPIVQKELPRQGGLFLYEYHEEPAALYYFNRRTQYIDSLADLDRYLQSQRPLYLVLRKDQYEKLRSDLDKRGFRLIRGTEGLKEDLVFLANTLT